MRQVRETIHALKRRRVSNENDMDLDRPWPNSHYEAFKRCFERGEFSEAYRSALISAVEGGRVYRDLGKKEDQFHRAIFYGLAAAAADKAGFSSDLVNMFLMARLVLDEIRPIRDSAGGYEVTLRGLESDLARLSEKVRALGIDPTTEPRTFLAMRMAIDRTKSN